MEAGESGRSGVLVPDHVEEESGNPSENVTTLLQHRVDCTVQERELGKGSFIGKKSSL